MMTLLLSVTNREEKKLDIWLPLNEYANKHQISISTLRRRIKSNKIDFKLDEGKYYLLEGEPAGASAETARYPNSSTVSISTSETISTTRILLDELKRAYLDSLQSKEDQILYLKQQVSDLKTLVMLLEKENSRLKMEDHS